MAITESIGYHGEVGEKEWAKLAPFIGARFAVAGEPDWKVTAVTSADRTVRIAPGVGYGDGVMDTNVGAVNLQAPVVSGAVGTPRWDAIVARRDWQPNPGGATVFTRVQGTASPVVPALLNDPGTLADQPLALVEFVAGSQLPRSIINLRTQASKVIAADSLLAIATAPLGTEAVIAGQRWRRQLVGSNVETVRVDAQQASGRYTATMPGGNVTSRTFTVALPPGRFSDAPEVMCGLRTASGNSGVIVARVTATTKDNFTLVLYRDGGGAPPADEYLIAWIAVA